MTEKKQTLLGAILGLLNNIFLIVFTFILVLVFNATVARITVVEGNSMYDSLNDNDKIVVSIQSHIDRYDVVVFEAKEDVYFIKRVYGLPGETVRIDNDSNIYINGEIIKDPYRTEESFEPGIAENEITLGDDEYFVLGDNRNESADSRVEEIGLVKKKSIEGEAWFRLLPLSKAGLVKRIE